MLARSWSLIVDATVDRPELVTDSLGARVTNDLWSEGPLHIWRTPAQEPADSQDSGDLSGFEEALAENLGLMKQVRRARHSDLARTYPQTVADTNRSMLDDAHDLEERTRPAAREESAETASEEVLSESIAGESVSRQPGYHDFAARKEIAVINADRLRSIARRFDLPQSQLRMVISTLEEKLRRVPRAPDMKVIVALKIRRVLIGSLANASSYRKQWAWDKMEVEQAWQRIEELRCERAILEKPVTVAIVDWGIQRDHEAFGPELVAPGACVLSTGNGNLGDDDGHGTMLAGTIAGVVTNIPGGGRAVSSVRLLPVKFIDARNPPRSDNAARAITYAVSAGAKIINSSWDVGVNSPELQKAIKYAEDENVLVVVAAGNGGSNNTDYSTYPASFRFTNMITVMASNEEDQKPGFSYYGDDVDIAAPGVNIISTSPYFWRPRAALSPFGIHPYRRYSGTSPAAAHVSGAAALLLSIKSSWTPQEIRACLIGSSDHITALQPFCPEGRRLNLRRAVERALNSSNGISSYVDRMHIREIVRTRLSGAPGLLDSADTA
jgi:subtilisin family serine protease